MKISAIVTAYNAQSFLPRAVGSLLANGYPKLEILLVEDGSKDNTLAAAQALQTPHPEQVRVLRHPGGVNRGVSASRNLGIKQAQGEAVCFLDADDYVMPHRFARAVQILQEQPAVDGVYDSTVIHLEGQPADSGVAGAEDGTIFGLGTAHEGEDLLRQLLRGYPWGSDAFLCRRNLFERIGTFDETLRIAEDCHLWFRAAALGRIVPGDLSHPVAVYVRHAANTFHYRIDRKVDLLRAMTRAWPIVRRHAKPSLARAFSEGMADYLVNTIVVAREAARPGVARAAARCVAFGAGAATLADSRVLRQLGWLLRETVFPRKPVAAPAR